MPILSDEKLREALQDGKIGITPAIDNIEPASIDLSVGEEAFLGTSEEIMKLSTGKLLIISAGGMALVITKEELQMSTRIVGHMGLQSYFTRKGLVLLAGPQIDPGFRGTLHLVVCNLSPTEIALSYGEPFCTVEFHELSSDVQQSYKGEYQEQKGITSKEISDIRQRRGFALSEVINNMQSIAQDISSLKESVQGLTKRTESYMAIFVTSLAALVIGVIIKLFVA